MRSCGETAAISLISEKVTSIQKLLNFSEKEEEIEKPTNLNQIQEVYDSEEESNIFQAKLLREQRLEQKHGNTTGKQKPQDI